MRRWNGWGDDSRYFPVPGGARTFLEQELGRATPLPDAGLETVAASVPDSRLPPRDGLYTDPGARIRHARGQSLPDWLAMRSGQFGSFPDAVAYPETARDVRQLIEFAHRSGAAVIPWGGGTSVAGHVTPAAGDRPVITLDTRRMNLLTNLDPVSRLATFGAGASGPQVEAQLRARGHVLGHFPQSWEYSTLGGWIATRSSGQQSLRYGRIEQLFAGGRLVTPKGPLDVPTVPASAAGPDLRGWILGSEGRMGLLTQATVRVRPIPEHESFHVLFFPDWSAGAAAVREAVQAGIELSMLRLSNPAETRTQLTLAGHEWSVRMLERYLAIRGAGTGKCMLTFGVTGRRDQCSNALQQSLALFRAHGGVSAGSGLGRRWARARFRSPYLRDSLWELGYAVDTLETAVDWPRVDPTMWGVERALRQALEDEGEPVHAFSHLSHVYTQGSSIYTTYLFRVADGYEATLERWRRLKHAASREIVARGGTISHQHGVGTDHAPYLAAEKGTLGIAAIRAACVHLDPDGTMNPGKLVPD
ncbi:MAG TPA: FAD-binding oxidoreductase [Gammaproteobacteria bacterium]|nr:FAD-binding oxidoreductase [Gammaproteobacteria bacterium]